MDVAGNAAGDGAAAAGAATAATNKALQLPPNTKNAVMETITSAQEGLATILTAMQDAEEGEGVPMPEELLGAIDQIGMQLCAFAEQHGQAAASAAGVQMNAAEVAIANALVDSAPEIAKAFSTKMSAGSAVAKATLKVAPAQMVGLLKELIEDFMGRAQKWGPMLLGDGSAPVAEPAAPAAAAKNVDAKSTLKNVAANAAARVTKALGSESSTSTATSETEMGQVLKALKQLPDLQNKLARLEKSLIGNGVGDALDDALGGGESAEKYAPGENMSAKIRKSLNSNGRGRVRDDDDDINLDD